MILERLGKIYVYKRTLWDMALNQLKAKYAGSLLGIWWAVCIPLLLALSINFVFNAVFQVEVKNYTSFLLSGIIPWFFFAACLEQSANSLVSNATLMRQGLFPREFLPMASILANFFNFLIGFGFLLPFFIIANVKVITLLPVLLIIVTLHLIFIIGLGLMLSLACVFLRDLSYFLSTALMVWFWITPVFYSLDTLPSHLRWICLLNPMSPFVLLYQKVLFRCAVPSFLEYSLVVFIAAGFFLIGYRFFLRYESLILKRI